MPRAYNRGVSRDRRPSFWESLKRALGTESGLDRRLEIAPTTPPFLAPEEPHDPLPAVQRTPGGSGDRKVPREDYSDRLLAPGIAAEKAAPPLVPGAPIPIEPVSLGPPRPDPIRSEPAEVTPSVLAAPPEPVLAAPPEPAPATLPPESAATSAKAPRLARGLASFSRQNPEREKKFAHLLRDAAPPAGKRPSRPRRRG
jgi:hypothetical protein